jgi:predicted transporter
LAAGSLLVLTAFLVWTVPAAVARLVRGQITTSTLAPPIVFSLLLGGGIREARAWNSQRSAQAI